MYFRFLPLLAIAPSLAYPVSKVSTTSFITPEIIQKISPASSSCAGASSECRTASQAAHVIAKSFAAYDITPPEAATLISLMAYETADFKYQKNHFPGRPGQGTRNMQMKTYNLAYATGIKALSSSVTKITGENDANSLTDAQANDILGLLIAVDEYDFGSAAWFLSTQCSEPIRDGLKTGGSQGWEAYLESCVGTSATADRQAYYQRALSALGVTS